MRNGPPIHLSDALKMNSFGHNIDYTDFILWICLKGEGFKTDSPVDLISVVLDIKICKMMKTCLYMLLQNFWS